MNEPDDWHGFWIGQQPTLCLWITYLRRAGPCHDFRAEAIAPGVEACFDFVARLGEFSLFRNQVKEMHETLQGTAHLFTIEGNVIVDATIDRRGHVFWEVTLHSRACESLPKLSFRIEEDQTLLWNVAAKIENMLEWLAEANDQDGLQ